MMLSPVQIKTSFFCVCFFFKNAGQKNCTKNFQPFSIFFSFFKQIKKIVVKVNLPTYFLFICLNFIWVGWDENLKIYWVWPKPSILFVGHRH